MADDALSYMRNIDEKDTEKDHNYVVVHALYYLIQKTLIGEGFWDFPRMYKDLGELYGVEGNESIAERLEFHVDQRFKYVNILLNEIRDNYIRTRHPFFFTDEIQREIDNLQKKFKKLIDRQHKKHKEDK